MKEALEIVTDFWNGIKKYFIPIIITLSLTSTKSIYEFKGLVRKNPITDIAAKKIIYKIYCTKDIISSLIITFNINDAKHFEQLLDKRMVLTTRQNPDFLNSGQVAVLLESKETRSLKISEIEKGEYNLEIPIVFLNSPRKFIHGKDGNLVFQIESENNKINTFSNVKLYSLYFWFFFHPLIAALALLLILIGLQLIISKFAKKIKK